jgi:hypothetical protein
MAKYPPAQGLFMALGQVLTGQPIVGVWLSAALMCAATYWMLRAWIPSRWALLGGIVVLLGFGLQSYWSRSYYGGAVAAAGGALLYGALRRILRKPQVGTAILFGLGLALLALTRPLEGAVTAAPACAVLTVWVFRNSGRMTSILLRLLLPLFLVGGATGAFMGYYNYRLTGSALSMPYFVQMRQYQYVPLLYFSPKGEIPEYRHEDLRLYELDSYNSLDADHLTLGRLIKLEYHKLPNPMQFFVWALGGVPIIAVLMVPWMVLRTRRMRLAALTVACVIVIHLLCTGYQPHYTAPVFCLLVVLLISALRHLYIVRFRNVAIGRIAAGILAAAMIVTALARLDHPLWDTYLYGRTKDANLAAASGALPSSILSRPAISALVQKTGPAVVIVKYSADRNFTEDWVYNAADIDGSPVIWARDMGPSRNAELSAYYPDRTVWHLEISAPHEPLRLTRYNQ